MKKDLKCADPGETMKAAAVRMRDENIGFLPMCNSDGRVLGTRTDRDIAMRVDAADPSAAQCSVAGVMTPEVACVRAGNDLAKVEQMMATLRKARIIVEDDDGRICGVIGLSDIAAADDPRARARSCAASPRARFGPGSGEAQAVARARICSQQPISRGRDGRRT